MKKSILPLCAFCVFVLSGCFDKDRSATSTNKPTNPKSEEKKDTIATPPPTTIVPVADYEIFATDSFRVMLKSYTKQEAALVAAINRVDVNLLRSQDSVVVPKDLTKPEATYFPFPLQLPFLQNVHKIIFFSYPTQAFAAYENGTLKFAGPTSMGKAKTKTPRGLFFTNWKSKESISTSNDEWILKWNFNIHNFMGVGFHQYQLPGYPASHSCLRLREQDAMLLYDWAQQWVLKDSGSTVAYYGTPVVVFGMYPFGHRKPWRHLAEDANALTISEGDLQAVVTDEYLTTIMERQTARQAYDSAKAMVPVE